jgi:hypothetical protein
MSSVAYPAQPAGPGWWHTAWLVFLGWLTAAVVLGSLFLAGTLAGAIGRNSNAVGMPDTHAINDWPFPQNGTWSLLADVSVFVLALGVTTIAIAWQLRGPSPTVSEGRLFVVLLFTGGAPFVTSHDSAPFFFLIAVWAVRAWVVKDELRIPRRPLLAVGAALALIIAAYGLFHPIWVESQSTLEAIPKSKQTRVVLMLHNSSRRSVEVEQLSAPGFTEGRVGPWEPGSRLPVRISGGHTGVFMLRVKPGTCGNGLDGSVRYRVFGRTLDEPLRLTLAALPGC